jgi:hypothetical protein
MRDSILFATFTFWSLKFFASESAPQHYVGSSCPRTCSNCGSLRPVFGVLGAAKSWVELICRECVGFREDVCKISKRCWQCPTSAIFGPKVIDASSIVLAKGI